MGTEATCKAKAFVTELGMVGSVFYHLALTSYYVLVLVHRWRPSQVRRVQVYLHAVPIVLALGLAFGSIPFYETARFCVVSSYEKGVWVALLFAVVPFFVVTVLSLINMACVYRAVRSTLRKNNHWRFTAEFCYNSSMSNDSNLGGPSIPVRRNLAERAERAVFWRGVLYLVSFFITWPQYLLVVVFFEKLADSYAFWVVSYLFMPLQG